MPSSAVRLGLFVLLLAPALGGAGCNRAKEAPPAPPPPKVGVVKPVVFPVQGFYEYNGTLETTKAVEIRARVKGILTDVYFTEGTEVRGPNPEAADEDTKRGEKLYAIEQREFKTAVRKAEAELAKAAADMGKWKAEIKLAANEVARLELAGTGTSKTELEKAKATLETNEAQLKAAEAIRDAAKETLQTATIQLGYTDIRAPLAGLISRTLVDEGNLVGQNEATLLTTIVRMDELYVLFDVPERDLVEYQQARARQKLPDPISGSIPVLVGVTGETGYPHPGKIDFRENKVDTGTGTIRIRGRLPNPKVPPQDVRILYPGLYARVRVPSGEETPRPVIPEEALMTGQEGRFVYVVKDGAVKKQVVTVGTQVFRAAPPGDLKAPPAWTLRNPGKDAPQPPAVRSVVAVEKGLGPDDVVVVDGLQRARPGAPVTPEMLEFAAPRAK